MAKHSQPEKYPTNDASERKLREEGEKAAQIRDAHKDTGGKHSGKSGK
jgi:hypothetical protein